MQTNQRKLRCRLSCWRYSARVILFSWGTECFSMYSLKGEEEGQTKNKTTVIPSQAGQSPCSVSPQLPFQPFFSLETKPKRAESSTTFTRTKGCRSPEEHLFPEPTVRISVQKSILLSAITLHIRPQSRLAHLADLIGTCCVSTA